MTVPTPIGDIEAHTAASSASARPRAQAMANTRPTGDALGERGFLVEGHGAHGDAGARAEEQEHGDERQRGGDEGGDPRPVDRRAAELELVGAPRDAAGCGC